MSAAVDARLIAQSPCQGIKKPRVPRRKQRFLTLDEVETLADALDAYYRPLLYSAVYLGARWGELAGLKREHLDLLHRRALIVGSLEEIGGRTRWLPETKSGTSRRVLSVPAFLVDVLAAHLAAAPPSEFVFTSKRGSVLRRSSFRSKVWLPAVAAAGLSPLRFHDLRHTCASLLIAEGAHPKEIQARLGHSSITTTLNVYGHLFPSLDERLAERLDATYRAAKGDTGGTRSDSTVVELDAAKTENSS
jgi:integrase